MPLLGGGSSSDVTEAGVGSREKPGGRAVGSGVRSKPGDGSRAGDRSGVLVRSCGGRSEVSGGLLSRSMGTSTARSSASTTCSNPPGRTGDSLPVPVCRVALLDAGAEPDPEPDAPEASGHGSRVGLFVGLSPIASGRVGETEGRTRDGDFSLGSSTLSSTLKLAERTGLRDVLIRPLRMGLRGRLGGRGLILASKRESRS